MSSGGMHSAVKGIKVSDMTKPIGESPDKHPCRRNAARDGRIPYNRTTSAKSTLLRRHHMAHPVPDVMRRILERCPFTVLLTARPASRNFHQLASETTVFRSLPVPRALATSTSTSWSLAVSGNAFVCPPSLAVSIGLSAFGHRSVLRVTVNVAQDHPESSACPPVALAVDTLIVDYGAHPLVPWPPISARCLVVDMLNLGRNPALRSVDPGTVRDLVLQGNQRARPTTGLLYGDLVPFVAVERIELVGVLTSVPLGHIYRVDNVMCGLVVAIVAATKTTLHTLAIPRARHLHPSSVAALKTYCAERGVALVTTHTVCPHVGACAVCTVRVSWRIAAKTTRALAHWELQLGRTVGRGAPP